MIPRRSSKLPLTKTRSREDLENLVRGHYDQFPHVFDNAPRYPELPPDVAIWPIVPFAAAAEAELVLPDEVPIRSSPSQTLWDLAEDYEEALVRFEGLWEQALFCLLLDSAGLLVGRYRDAFAARILFQPKRGRLGDAELRDVYDRVVPFGNFRLTASSRPTGDGSHSVASFRLMLKADQADEIRPAEVSVDGLSTDDVEAATTPTVSARTRRRYRQRGQTLEEHFHANQFKQKPRFSDALTAGQCAKKFGVSTSTVTRRLRKSGVRSTDGVYKITPEIAAALRAHFLSTRASAQRKSRRRPG